MLQLPVLLHYLFLKIVFNVEHLQNAYIAFFFSLLLLLRYKEVIRVVCLVLKALNKEKKNCVFEF